MYSWNYSTIEDVHCVLQFELCELILDPWTRGQRVDISFVTSNPTHMNVSFFNLSILYNPREFEMNALLQQTALYFGYRVFNDPL